MTFVSNTQDTSVFADKMQSFLEKRKLDIDHELRKTSPTDPRYLTLKIELLFLNSKDFYLKLKDNILGSLIQEE
jgi:ATP-dependent helicase STH1/SNF2